MELTLDSALSAGAWVGHLSPYLDTSVGRSDPTATTKDVLGMAVGDAEQDLADIARNVSSPDVKQST